MATHCSILAWRIPTERGAWRATIHGVPASDMTERLSTTQHSIPLYIYATSSSSIHLLIDIWVTCISWLLKIVLL